MLLPTLLVKVDHARVYNICMFFWPLTYLAVPLLNIVARRGVHERTLGFNLDLSGIYTILYIFTQCKINYYSSFFALSTSEGVLGGYLWLFVMVLVAPGGCLISRGIPCLLGYVTDSEATERTPLLHSSSTMLILPATSCESPRTLIPFKSFGNPK
jgi:hypothetical protein